MVVVEVMETNSIRRIGQNRCRLMHWIVTALHPLDRYIRSLLSCTLRIVTVAFDRYCIAPFGSLHGVGINGGVGINRR